MHRAYRHLGSFILAVAIGAPLMTTGCAVHAYRVYDPDHHDYHRWDHNEEIYYQEWSVDTHHDPHRDFRNLPPDDQKQYWNWRHDHPNGDRDHDHDHDHDHH
ncbi:MAG TPA: hypothetical protein VLV49_03495 [Terriglobales bacterium]|nr:hypothetical protein [Terriglobales bacterium]